DPKVQRLPAALFKVWVNILCIASRHGGKIPSDDLAFLLRMDEGPAVDAVAKLVDAGLIDGAGGGLEPHNWSSRQYKSDSSAERVKKLREKRKGNGACNGDVTANVTPPDTETETDSSVADATDAGASSARNLSVVVPHPTYTDAVH